MKKLFRVSTLIYICFLIGCSDDNSVNNSAVKKYPDSLGNEWEYKTTFSVLFYDSSGNVYGNDTLFIGNTIAKIINDNDSLGNFKNLVLFSSYDIDTPQNINFIWYNNIDDGLFAIAYSGPGSSQPILPKSITLDQNDFLAKLFSRTLTPIQPVFTKSIVDDSIQYYDPQRTVLKYPLRVGLMWNEIIPPFSFKKSVTSKQVVVTQAGSFNCYIVKTEIEEFPNLHYNDYYNLDIGLVYREIAVDSMIHSNENGDTLGFINSTSVSELIRRE